jgi:hypothetical protein
VSFQKTPASLFTLYLPLGYVVFDDFGTELSHEQSQVGSLPRMAPAMTAAAHPTPASTVTAPSGQFN